MANGVTTPNAGMELRGNTRSAPRCVHLWPSASPLPCLEPRSARSDAVASASLWRLEQVAEIFAFSIHGLIPKRLFWV
jgi:hypothetical protein